MPLSFRFLNPRLVDRWPSSSRDVCYLAYNDEPAILCGDLPANRWRFLGTWHLTPERHAMEWIGFVLVGGLILTLLRPRLSSYYIHTSDDPNDKVTSKQASAGATSALLPRIWMKIATLLLYPYVAWTKLSWEGSNYPGRWILFVGMPVGTLWLVSALFSFSPWAATKNSVERRHTLLQLWLSFLPSLFPVLQALIGSVRSILRQGGDDIWDMIYNVAYTCHGLILMFVPIYYVLVGELTMLPPTWSIENMDSLLRLPVEWIIWQAVGNALAAVYYMGIVTPVSIFAGLNVNSMLVPDSNYATQNYRINGMLLWFAYGCCIRFLLCAVELIITAIRGRPFPRQRKRQE